MIPGVSKDRLYASVSLSNVSRERTSLKASPVQANAWPFFTFARFSVVGIMQQPTGRAEMQSSLVQPLRDFCATAKEDV